MFKKFVKSCLLTVLMALSATTVFANEVIFSYDNGSVETLAWGTRKAEWYDVAIYVPASYAGKTVTGIRLPFTTSSEDIKDISLWLSEELALAKNDAGKKVAAPDICSVAVSLKDVDGQGLAEVTFSEPYTITEKGVYAGCTFNVSSIANERKCEKPLTVTDEVFVEGSWFHSHKTQMSWTGTSEVRGHWNMQVILSGVEEYAVLPVYYSSVTTLFDKDFSVVVGLENKGSKEVTDVDISYEIGSVANTFHVDLPQPLQAVIGSSTSVVVNIPALGETGGKNVNVKVEKVNGEPNALAGEVATTPVSLISFIPDHRAVVEEYTGLWCTWCPRGYIGMERMNHLYPNEFIGIAYHDTDEMQVIAATDYPSYVDGLPAAWVDRTSTTDAFFGYGSDGFGLDKMWEIFAQIPAKAAVDVEAKLSDDLNYVEGTVTLTPALSEDAPNCHLEIILTADSLYNAEWLQKNGYVGGPAPDDGEDWDVFVNGGQRVAGLIFNDVIVATSRLSDSNILVDAPFVDKVPMNYAYRFDLNQVPVYQHKHKLNFIALLVADDGKIINADKVRVEPTAGIGSIEAESPAEIVGYYDLTGRPVANPSAGIYIVRTADGRFNKQLIVY